MELCAGRIVVGIDGSDAAVRAAEWAGEEARRRGVGLTLVHVIDTYDADDPRACSDVEVSCATGLLARARSAVERRDPDLDAATTVERGELVRTLTNAAVDAVLLCVGAPKRGYRTEILGNIPAALSEAARCPVVLVPTYAAVGQAHPWVAVELDRAENQGPLTFAADEAARWNATLLVVSRFPASEITALADLVPDIDVRTETSEVGVFEMLRHTALDIRCVVVSPSCMASFSETDPPALVVRT